MRLPIAAWLLWMLCPGVVLADQARAERALNCQLADEELAGLMQDLAADLVAFRRPVAQYGAPTANVYAMPVPLKAFGHASSMVVVMPARVLLAVEGRTVRQASMALGLHASSFGPASRQVRPGVSAVAFQLSHPMLAGKLLVGCEYASEAAARWPGSP